MSSRLLNAILQLLLLLCACTACCCPCEKLKFHVPCCYDGRRPQVMVEGNNYTLQYDWRCPASDEYQQQNVERPCDETTRSNYNYTCCQEDEEEDQEHDEEEECEEYDECGCIIEKESGPLEDPCLDIKRPSQRRYPSKRGQCRKQCYDPCQVPPGELWPYLYPIQQPPIEFCDHPLTDNCRLATCCKCACSNCGCCGDQCCCEEELDPYRFAIGDTMSISVFDEEEASVETVTVAADGKIYYLFLEGIQAVGKTIDELAKEITAHLQVLYSNPIVSIAPTTSFNSTFTILGRVFSPGVYPVPGKIKLREAIAIAGGIYQRQFDEESIFNSFDPLPLANLHCSFIVRDGKRIAADFHKVLFTADQGSNINVYPGDYIYIAPAYNQQVFVLGNVSRPLRIPFQRGMSLMEALTIAGGWTSGFPQSANMSKVLVIRGELCCPCVICVDLFDIIEGVGSNFVLMPGDIIFVPNKKFRFGRELVLLAINTFVQSFATSAGSFYGQNHWFNDFGPND